METQALEANARPTTAGLRRTAGFAPLLTAMKGGFRAGEAHRGPINMRHGRRTRAHQE
jgi:hypothetical protein